MINKLSTMRTVADNLTRYLCMETKPLTKIKKPSVIIPGAIATTGVVVTLDTTKDNHADLIVQKDNEEIQRASFDYNETEDGYELVSAMSSYFCDDKENKEIKQNHYLIEPGHEKVYEHSINYANAPMREGTRIFIDKINSSVAQASGYKSGKTDYDPQESHTYGKKSLQRDIPALLKILEIIAPNSEFTLKMKDKLKKDNKTSLVAFEVNNTENGNEIVRGFMSANGDSVSYRINTEDMTLIGEQSINKDLSRAYLKPEQAKTEQLVVVEEDAKQETTEVENSDVVESAQKEESNAGKASDDKSTIQTSESDTSKKDGKKGIKSETVQNGKKGIKEDEKSKPVQDDSASVQNAQTPTDNGVHVYPTEYYINSIVEAATNETLSTRKKAEVYKDTLALAYLDGYSKPELENILLGNGLLSFSSYCKKAYVEAAIAMAQKIDDRELPAKTLEDKINELQNIKIDTEDEDLKICVQSMVGEIKKMQNNAEKETYVDKALSTLKDNLSDDYESRVLSFIQEVGKINDDFKLHYEIYVESVNNAKVSALKSQLERMINNIPDANHHEQRDKFLTQLYIAKDLKELERLQFEVQKLLNEKLSSQSSDELTGEEAPKRLSIGDLSSTNKKIVRDLLSCRSPRDMSLSFSEIRNLLLDMGFTENVSKSSHRKFIPPLDIFFNGEKQPFLIVATHGRNTPNPAQIDDLINVCKQYYGSDEK